MHEMALAESVLQLIEDAAHTRKFRRVYTVVLEIGALAAVEPDALRFCFDAAARGGIAEGARLEILDTPGKGCCKECGKFVLLHERFGLCPECGGARVEITGGNEMRVQELEVE